MEVDLDEAPTASNAQKQIKEPFNQEILEAETDREIESPIRIRKAEKAARKAAAAKKKKQNSKSGFSSDSDEGSPGNGPDIRDMDPDFDPECTVAAKGPPREGMRTRKKSTKK
jgi:hypothetical protein